MRKLFHSVLFFCLSINLYPQSKTISLYDFMYKLAPDSGKHATGDWSVGKPAFVSIKWKNNRIEMSEDMKINFFREGAITLSVNGVVYQNMQNKPIGWYLMLRGPRSGFTNYLIMGMGNNSFKPMLIDSLLGKKRYTYQLLKTCSGTQGFYYYQLKFPKKDPLWMKLSWMYGNSGVTLRIEVYDDGSKSFADLNCAM